MFILSLIATLVPNALAAEPTVIRQDTGNIATATMALVITCQANPDSELGKKISYVNPGYRAAGTKLVEALTERSDVETLIFFDNPTAQEVSAWMATQTELQAGAEYREVILAVACGADGGDMDAERLYTKDVDTPGVGGLKFASLVTGMATLGQSSVWLLEASWNLSAAMGTYDVTSYGPTADDVVKYTKKDALAVSTGPAGKFAQGGLIAAAADVIEASKGAKLTLGEFFYAGIKPRVPTLELSTSMGILQGDMWNGNENRIVLMGGPLIGTNTTIDLATVKPPSAPKLKVPTGCYLATGGVLAMVGAGVIAIDSAGTYQSLEIMNTNGGSQNDLDAAVTKYRTDNAIAISVGALGVLATAGGITWTVLDHGKTTVTVSGTTVSGNF